MAELHDYEVEINGFTTTLRLSAEDAKQRGLTRKAAPKKAADAKARTEPAKSNN